MKRIVVLFVILSMLSTSFVVTTTGSSAGDDGAPPPTGGGGGGGGGPQFFDYYVPLVFDESHPNGLSEVVIWTLSPSLLITTFAQNEFGSNIGQLREPTKLVFNPSDNRGLTNGSLIRTTAPAQVIGQRSGEDIQQDTSFAYSILPRRMMGFEYDAPFDGTLSLVTLNAGTEVNIQSKDGSFATEIFDGSTNAMTVEVSKGDYINTTFPTIGAFHSYLEGESASMAVPQYLRGSTYYFDGDLTSPRPNEIDLSYLSLNPSEPTELTLYYANGSVDKFTIFAETLIDLQQGLRGINSSRGTIEVNLRVKYAYGGLTRSSTIQLMAINEMRAAEFFLTPTEFSTHFSSGTLVTEYNFSRYSPEEQGYIASSRQIDTVFEREVIQVVSLSDHQLIVASDYLFGFSISPGKVSHPMAPSMAFINLPFNTATQKNITGLAGTWYRFANLAVTNLEVVPGPVEEYTGQMIRIEITANGTLPASAFQVEIIVDDEVEIDERFDFLQVNDTIVFEIRKFLPVGKQKLNISVNVDTDNEVNEFNEDDNFVEEGYNVQRNIRLRGTIYIALMAFLGYGIVKIRSWLKDRRKVNRSHVDAILTFEEEDE